MAQLVLGAVGAYVGFMVGGPQGASIGWSIGSAIGSSMTPGPHTEGPRLADLKVQQSSYGAPIPIVYGTVRLSGNVIWASDLMEQSHDQSAGGKGGGGPTSTTFTYSKHLAVSLCSGPIVGVSKIWRNGELIYDVSPGNLGATGNTGSIRIYTGDSTQVADALIESYVGIGNTPAYRDTAYVVFEDHDVTDTGGRAPQFSFEVIETGNSSVPATTTWGNWDSSGKRHFAQIPDSDLFFAADSTNVTKVNLWNSTTKTIVRTYSTGWTNANDAVALVSYCSTNNTLWVGNQYPTTDALIVFDVQTGAIIRDVLYFGGPWPPWGDLMYDDLTGYMVCLGAGGLSPGAKIEVASYIGSNFASTMPDYAASGLDMPGEQYFFSRWGSHSIALINKSDLQLAFAQDVGSSFFTALDSVNHRLLFIVDQGSNSGIFIMNLATPPLEFLHFADIAHTTPTLAAYSSFENILWCGFGSAMVGVNMATGSVVRTETSSGNPAPNDLVSFVNPERPYRLLCAGNSSVFYDIRLGAELTSGSVLLSDIVTDLCGRSGLNTINVSQLTDTVDGYTVTAPMSARAAIEPLQYAYFFDSVESDSTVKFIRRGGAIVDTINNNDLSANQGGQSMPDDLSAVRRQELDLPRKVTIAYPDTSLDLQTNTQYARRLTGYANKELNSQLTICMSANKAQQIADVALYASWSERNPVQFSLPRKYAYLEPTDAIALVRNNITYRLRINNKDESATGLLNFDAVTESAEISPTTSVIATSIYLQTSNGVAPNYTAQTIPTAPLTRLIMLDTPILRDVDNDAGFYVVANGYSSGWIGSQIFKSTDGITYSSSITIPNAATTGVCTTSLGNFSSGNIFDETNVVTVVMQNGALSSTTELLVLNGSNVAVLGSEIIQFKTATLIAANTYTLSGLLRGRRGTEWAMSTHAVGDIFVLASDITWRRIPMSSSEIGLLRYWKAVTTGRPISSAPAISHTDNAVGLECYSPVHLGGGRASNGDITLVWVRRNRTHADWLNYIDTPMTESTESYEVEVYSSSSYLTLKRTITGLTAPTTTYTHAQQVTDFGSDQSVLYFKVFQLSALVGRGYEARGVI